MKRKRPPLSIWGKAGAVILGVNLFMALFGPLVAPVAPGEFLAVAPFSPPGDGSFLGTDYIGRDLFSRMLYGASFTVAISFAATVVGFAGGVGLGFIGAEAGARVDAAIFRVVDVLISFPPILFALLVIASLGSSIPVLVCTVGMIHAPRVARIARAVARDIGVQDFVEAARARGETLWSILGREIWPNSLMPLAAEFGLRMAYAVLLLSALSFLGLGIQPPSADWGAMVRENMSGLFYSGWAVILPAAAIAIFVIGINLFVDSFLAQSDRDISKDMLG